MTVYVLVFHSFVGFENYLSENVVLASTNKAKLIDKAEQDDNYPLISGRKESDEYINADLPHYYILEFEEGDS